MYSTSQLIHSNTPCSRFWDGFFNFSHRDCFIKKIHGKEIQAIEILNPRASSQIALKIALLFTIIVPLMAAIHYLIKVCRFRNFKVTLLRPQEMDRINQKTQAQFGKIEELEFSINRVPAAPMRIIQPFEEQATITQPAEQQPLDVNEAFLLIKKGHLKAQHLSKFSENELGEFLNQVGTLLERKIKEHQEDDTLLNNLLKMDLVPFMLSVTDCKKLLSSLIQLRPKETEENILSFLKINPTSAAQIFDNVNNVIELTGDEDWTIYDNIALHYLAQEGVLKDPNYAVNLIEFYSFRDILNNALDDHSKAHEKTLQSLLTHKDITPQNQLKLILWFYNDPTISSFIFDILNNPDNFEKLQKTYLEPTFDQLKYEGVKKEWSFYLILINIFSINKTPIEKTSFLFKGRPNDFDSNQVPRFYKELLFAVETIYHLHQNKAAYFERVLMLNKSEIGEILAKITPVDLFKNLLFSFKDFSRHVIHWIFSTRNEDEISFFLKIVLNNFNKVFLDNSSFKDFFNEFNTSQKLELALDTIEKLPLRRRAVFLHAFSGGIRSYDSLIKISLSKELIIVSFNKKQLPIQDDPISYVNFDKEIKNA